MKKDVDNLIFKTCSKTFQAYWLEMRRHETALRKIFAKDKDHKCVPEEIGSVRQVHPKSRHVLTFFRCALCLKDLPPK